MSASTRCRLQVGSNCFSRWLNLADNMQAKIVISKEAALQTPKNRYTMDACIACPFLK